MRGPLWNTSFLSCHGSRGPWILATPSNPASWRRRGRSEVAAEPQGPRAVVAAWKPGQRLAAPDSDPAKLEECAPGAICSASWFYDQSPEGERMSSFARPPPLRGAGSVRRGPCQARRPPQPRPGHHVHGMQGGGPSPGPQPAPPQLAGCSECVQAASTLSWSRVGRRGLWKGSDSARACLRAGDAQGSSPHGPGWSGELATDDSCLSLSPRRPFGGL